MLYVKRKNPCRRQTPFALLANRAKFTVDETEEGLTITTAYALPDLSALTPLFSMQIGMMVIAIGNYFIQQWFGEVGTIIGIVALQIGCVYCYLAVFANGTFIEVDRTHFTIRNRGRVPSFRRRKRAIAAEDVLQLYVMTRTRTIKTTEATYYYLCVVTKGGWRKILLEAPRAQAVKLERKIESLLSIKAARVKPTWYQRWFLRENTLDNFEDLDEKASASSLPTMFAKSFPIPIEVILFFTWIFLVAAFFGLMIFAGPR